MNLFELAGWKRKYYRQSTINAMEKKPYVVHQTKIVLDNLKKNKGKKEQKRKEKKNNCQSQMEQIVYIYIYICIARERDFFVCLFFFQFTHFIHLWFSFFFLLYKLLAVKTQNFARKPPAPLEWNRQRGEKRKKMMEKIECVYRKWKQAIKSIYLALIFELLQLFA